MKAMGGGGTAYRSELYPESPYATGKQAIVQLSSDDGLEVEFPDLSVLVERDGFHHRRRRERYREIVADGMSRVRGADVVEARRFSKRTQRGGLLRDHRIGDFTFAAGAGQTQESLD